MKKHILRIRKIDKTVFDSIKNKKKIIETRAATNKFRKIEKDDILVFVCEDKRLEKQIKQVKNKTTSIVHFSSFHFLKRDFMHFGHLHVF